VPDDAQPTHRRYGWSEHGTVLPWLFLAMAAVAIALCAALEFALVSQRRVAGQDQVSTTRARVYRVANEVVTALETDPTPAAQSRHDPAWRVIRGRGSPSESAFQPDGESRGRLEELSSRFNPAIERLQLLTEPLWPGFRDADAAHALPVRRAQVGRSRRVACDYGSLFSDPFRGALTAYTCAEDGDRHFNVNFVGPEVLSQLCRHCGLGEARARSLTQEIQRRRKRAEISEEGLHRLLAGLADPGVSAGPAGGPAGASAEDMKSCLLEHLTVRSRFFAVRLRNGGLCARFVIIHRLPGPEHRLLEHTMVKESGTSGGPPCDQDWQQ
jgi:hypothetical protein